MNRGYLYIHYGTVKCCSMMVDKGTMKVSRGCMLGAIILASMRPIRRAVMICLGSYTREYVLPVVFARSKFVSTTNAFCKLSIYCGGDIGGKLYHRSRRVYVY